MAVYWWKDINSHMDQMELRLEVDVMNGVATHPEVGTDYSSVSPKEAQNLAEIIISSANDNDNTRLPHGRTSDDSGYYPGRLSVVGSDFSGLGSGNGRPSATSTVSSGRQSFSSSDRISDNGIHLEEGRHLIESPFSDKGNSNKILCDKFPDNNIHNDNVNDSDCDNDQQKMKSTHGSERGRNIWKGLTSSGCKVRSIPHDTPIRGVTASGEKIFIVREERRVVNVYDNNSLEHLYDMIVVDLKSPGDALSCSKHNRLYISDWGNRNIRALDLNSKTYAPPPIDDDENNTLHTIRISHPTCYSWLVRGWPRGLSLTIQNNLLATLLDQFGCGGQIVEYAASSGEILRTIDLNENITWPHQAVQLSSGQLVVSHGMGLQSLHRISCIQNDGRVTQFYGDEDKRGNEKLLDCPYSICKDGDDMIYMADCSNNKIHVFSPDCKHIGRITALTDLYRPYRIFMDEQNGRLYLAEVISGRVVIFSP